VCRGLLAVACGCEFRARGLFGERVREGRIERAGMDVVWVDLVKACGSLGRLGDVRVVGDEKRCGCWLRLHLPTGRSAVARCSHAAVVAS
jgi:hypothetical protein